MRNYFMILIVLSIFLGACSQCDNFFEEKNTPPNLILKTLKHFGTPIANLEFRQYLSRDYTNNIDTGYIELYVKNLESIPIDSLAIAIFLYDNENYSSNDLEQAKKKEFLITNLNDTTSFILFKNVSTLKTANHLEVFCTHYNNQNIWSGFYFGQVESLDTTTTTLLNIPNVYGVITADQELEFKFPFSPISTQQIRGKFTIDFKKFIGFGYNDAGDTTATLSLDTLINSGQNTNLILNYQPKDNSDLTNQLNFLLLN